MRVWRDFSEVPRVLDRTAVTIGNFDGVHLGHQAVVRRTRELANNFGVDTVVAVIFDPHPIALLRPDLAPAMLTTIDQRLDLLAKAGVDSVLVIPFSPVVAAWTPNEFVERILSSALHARVVVVGANFAFGHRAAGDCALLRRAGVHHDFVLEEVTLHGGAHVWSSTLVRTCLAAGDVAGAAEALGRPFAIHGEVVEVVGGEDSSRDVPRSPAAIVPVRGGLAVPADGKYTGQIIVLDGADAGTTYPATVSVGPYPRIRGEGHRYVASYDPDCTDLELSGRRVEVAFLQRLG